ncbi:MAG: UvrD-helicase domain-containing protein, partial [Anaerolineae bacterium]|nr:UvrD-helicase domain-containing protein [Anaerolineae bacterium]
WEIVFAQRDALYGDDLAVWLAAVEALAGGIKLNVGSAKNWGDKERLDDAKLKLSTIRDRAKGLLGAMLPRPGDRDVQAAGWLQLWRDAIRAAADEYAALKQDRTALDFDDLEAHARRLVNEFPGVVARYESEFNHILVDEFQDTNPAQRDIITRLAQGVGNNTAGRLFVVGDPKQSIYAFRGADVSVFGSVRADLLASGGRDLPLSMSFRSHSVLVAAFNDLFGRILQVGEGPAARYEVDLGPPLEAFRPAEYDEQAAPLTVYAFPRPDRETYPDFGADDRRRWEAGTLADHIHGMVHTEIPVFDRTLNTYRPVQYGDVAILFQAMTRAPLYEDVFKAAQLPYVTIAGKGYYDRQEVRDLLNLLAALHNPADDLALASVLRSPLFGLSDDALLALRLAFPHTPLHRALRGSVPDFPDEDCPALEFARSVLRDLYGVAGRATIADLLVRALDQTGFLATLTGLPDGDRRRGNIEKLVALARESGRISLGAFTAYARDLTAREVREGEVAVEVAGAVQVMSVHASKGLEFPVVILADASWDRAGRADTFTLDPDAGAACTLPVENPDADDPHPFAWEYTKQLAARRDRAERRRLLYVGATRAQDYLIVSGSLDRLRPDSWLGQWLAALGVDTTDLDPSPDPTPLDFAWGTCWLHVPDSPLVGVLLAAPAAEMRPGTRQAAPLQENRGHWDHPAIRDAESVPGVDPVLPPLVEPYKADPHAPARVLQTATHIDKLGRARYFQPQERGWAAFRQSVLHDAPDPVRPLPERELNPRSLRRAVGDMVHRALQVGALPGQTHRDDLQDRLRVYAWENGLTHPAQVSLAIREAVDLLRRFEASDLPERLGQAQTVYREIPFVHRIAAGEDHKVHEIHGIIDVLFQDQDGSWFVLDYKTAAIQAGNAADHARRYMHQLGAYARAVEAQTGAVPATLLYYIHPGVLVRVPESAWAAALEGLDGDVVRGLGD